MLNGHPVWTPDGLRIVLQARGERAKQPGLEVSLTIPIRLCDELNLFDRSPRRQLNLNYRSHLIAGAVRDAVRDVLREIGDER